MPVPIAPMYENDFMPRRKNQIGPTGKRRNVKPVAIPESVNDLADGHFGAGVLGMDSPHDKGTLCVIDVIRHTLGPRQEGPLVRYVLLRSLTHNPGQRDFLFLSDSFKCFVNFRGETDRGTYTGGAL